MLSDTQLTHNQYFIETKPANHSWTPVISPLKFSQNFPHAQLHCSHEEKVLKCAKDWRRNQTYNF